MLRLAIAVHFWKAATPMEVTPLGIVNWGKPVQLKNAQSPMVVSASGRIMSVTNEQPSKA